MKANRSARGNHQDVEAFLTGGPCQTRVEREEDVCAGPTACPCERGAELKSVRRSKRMAQKPGARPLPNLIGGKDLVPPLPKILQGSPGQIGVG